MKTSIYFVSLFLFAFISRINAQIETKIFSGSIGESRIQMTLQKKGEALSGTYFYEKVGKDLTVSGTIEEDNTFTLVEKSPAGVKTGEFNGTWNKAEGEDGITVNGSWKNPAGTKTLDFYLIEQMIFFTNGARLSPQVFAEKNKPKLFEITVEYPQLSGVSLPISAKFNQLAKSMATNESAKFRKDLLAQTAEDLKFTKERGGTNTIEISYNISHADNEIVSVLFGNYFYTGGVHPNSYSFVLNYDLKTGRELKLADLFKPNSDYLKVISGYSIGQLKKDLGEDSDAEWIEAGAGAKAENYKNWNITKKGILITFDSYQVASYAAGPQEVTIPFAEIKNILRNDFAVTR